MQKKTLEILFELQPQRKPSFLNYALSYKSIIFFAIFIAIAYNWNYVISGVIYMLYLWWDLPRSRLTYSMKITDRRNLKNLLNTITKRFYTGSDDYDLKKVLADKILNVDEKGKKR